MTGFVEPFRFSESDRTDLEGLLGKHRAGDAEGRRLLIAATEYEIGLCLDGAMRNPEPRPTIEDPPVSNSPADAQLRPIASAAGALSSLLKASSEESRQQLEKSMSAADPLGRSYDHFLACLATELDRLADSCGPIGDEEVPNPGPLPEYAQTFLRQMWVIYSECLEIEPTTVTDEPFCQYLDAISAMGDIGPFHSETVLRKLLAS